MKIVIAGANGFIGKRLVSIIVEEGKHDLVAVVRPGCSYEPKLPGIKVLACPMEDYRRIGRLTGRADCFINLTWSGSRGDARQDYGLQKLNYEAAIASMESMAEAGTEILVTSGSQAEYGICNDVITEETCCSPNTEYGYFKLKVYEDGKNLCRKRGIRIIEPRYFSLYGPGDYEKTLVMSCIKKMKAGLDIRLNACTQIWDYMYVDDAVRALLRLCENKEADGVYNFATGNYRMIKEYVMEMKAALHSESKITFDAPESYGGLIINLRPDIGKLLKAAKGWRAVTDFAEGIKLTAEKL